MDFCQKKSGFDCISFHSSCLSLSVQSLKFPENTLIMKLQPAYNIRKRFDKVHNTKYAEPK